MNKFKHQMDILHNRHSKYYEKFTERSSYHFKSGEVKPIAYYLPQFHTFPENDKWWGPGFTEWTNVTKATSQFEGHYQPHLAGELGYYDLLNDGVIKRQIELAKMYGIYGFCFHFYMFNNRKRLLEKPLNNFLKNKDLNMPFCLCYANENWTRRWDGMEQDVLIEQTYDCSFVSDLALELLPYLQDFRYIKIDNKPLIIIYKSSILPNLTEFAKRFRQECCRLGIAEIYLCSALLGDDCDARNFGFDDNVEFPPHNTSFLSVVNKLEMFSNEYNGNVFSYPHIVKSELDKQIKFPRLRGVMPSWDNVARRPMSGDTFHGSTPKLYQTWLQGVCNKAIKERPESQRFVFINAWNEWAEGAHLEPDRRYGYAYLEATYQAIINQQKLINYKEFDDFDFISYEGSLVEDFKFPKNSHMQLFYYQNGEINIENVQTLYFIDELMSKFNFTLNSICDLTHIRIDLANIPLVAKIQHVKLILNNGIDYVLSPCYSNANMIDANTYTYLHDDPINLYYLSDLLLPVQKISVEIVVDLHPIKKSEVIRIANQTTAFQNSKFLNVQNELNITKNELNITKNELNITKNELNITKNELISIFNSNSWKLTKPVRYIVRRCRVLLDILQKTKL